MLFTLFCSGPLLGVQVSTSCVLLRFFLSFNLKNIGAFVVVRKDDAFYIIVPFMDLMNHNAKVENSYFYAYEPITMNTKGAQHSLSGTYSMVTSADQDHLKNDPLEISYTGFFFFFLFFSSLPFFLFRFSESI